MKPTIELRGAAFRNKGAELMLRTALRRLRDRFPQAEFAMECRGDDETTQSVVALGICRKVAGGGSHLDWSRLQGLVPGCWKRRMSARTDADIDVVVDLSGLSYADAGGLVPARKLAQQGRHRHQKWILLPQAFGPFSDHRLQAAMRLIGKRADVLFPRDRRSYRFLSDLGIAEEQLQLSPDFTIAASPLFDSAFDHLVDRVAFVPNDRMRTHTSGELFARYRTWVVSALDELEREGHRPFVLIHDARNDARLLHDFFPALGDRFDVVRANDPFALKGILGRSRAVIGSRFHALVGALSQGVPTLATGWNHKYAALLEDFDCPNRLLDLDGVEPIWTDWIQLLRSEDALAEERARIIAARAPLIEQVEAMWIKVFSVIEEAQR